MRYFTLHISNPGDTVSTCELAGHVIVVAIKTLRPGVTIAIVKDPDGNWVGFLQSD
jgi:hypothetical protein